jgi:hypothetical protein
MVVALGLSPSSSLAMQKREEIKFENLTEEIQKATKLPNLYKRTLHEPGSISEGNTGILTDLQLKEGIETLPKDLLSKLGDASLIGQPGRLKELIDQVADTNEKLAVYLNEQLASFNLEEIKKLFSKTRGHHE